MSNPAIPTKKLVVGLFITTALLGVVIPTSVHYLAPASDSTNPEALKAQALAALKKQENYDQISIFDDYGVYGDCYLARYWGMPGLETLCCERIGSVVIPSPDTNTVLAYNGSSFLRLKQAFADLWLTQEDLSSLAEKEMAKRPYWSQYLDNLSETNGAPLVLAKKEAWSGSFASADSLSSLEVQIDPVFNAHAFALKDFGYAGLASMAELSSPAKEGHYAFRLALKKEGQEAIKAAINALADLDFVVSAYPSQLS